MEKLLLEIGAEEIPAGYMEPALTALSNMLTAKLTAARIDHGEARTFGTPRRLAVEVSDVALKQRSESTELLGPPAHIGYDPDGNPTVAAEKFAEKAGIAVGRLKTKTTAKGRYLAARKTERGVATRTVLKRLLPEIVLSVPFPKSMRWAELNITFARPIHSIVALLGTQAVLFNVGEVKSARYSRGHAFMAPGKIKLDHAADYAAALEKAEVIVDIEKRRAMVAADVAKAAAAAGGRVLEDPGLLDTVTHLVEYPVATTGRFENEFLEVPKEVLITAMREHQKYFAVVDDKGDLMPAFVAVNNTRTRDLDLVATGHERVLRARLSDAKFFYRADLQVSNDDRVSKLGGVLFQAKLGSMLEKSERVAKLGAFLVDATGADADLQSQVARAAMLCKSDLVSQVVGEFPKLQGVMGRVYAAVAGEPGEVPAAIEEHYRPTRSGGALPETRTGALVSIADKMDSICGCFSVGLSPTGAADPYALRRQAIGVVQVMRSFDLSISLKEMIRFSLSQFGDKTAERMEELAAEIYVFMTRRIDRILIDEGFAKDVVTAVAAVSVANIPDVWQRVAALQELKTAPDFEPLATAFKRVVNIIHKSGDQAAETVRSDLFSDPSESALHEAYQAVSRQVSGDLEAGRYPQALRRIATLRGPVDAFFEGVLVMAEDERLRRNRLALLQSVAGLFERFADFSSLST